MDTYGLDVESWAEQNVGECDFNDKRLTDRLVAHIGCTFGTKPSWLDCSGLSAQSLGPSEVK